MAAPSAGLASSEQSTSINPPHILTVGTLVRASATEDKQRISTVVAVPSAGLAPSEQSPSINPSHNLTVGTLVRASANNEQSTNIHCSGRALCRPRTLRTCKYHTNAYPLQGVSLRGRPQAVMIHNLLVGCRNLRSSLEEVDSLLTPDKTSGTSAVWGYEIAQSSASKRLTSRMRKILTIYGLYKSFIISISVLMTRVSSFVRCLEYPMMRGSFECCDIHYSCI